jgi:hypothetical protein
MHFEKNVYQSKSPNIGDYDTMYGSTQMCAYCDAHWVSNMDDREFVVGYVFLLGNGVINYNRKKHTSIACHQ